MLTEPLQGMADRTDVGMAKEDHGPMMSIEFQVIELIDFSKFL